MRLAAQAKGGYYPTPPRVVDLVSKLLYGARGRSPERGHPAYPGPLLRGRQRPFPSSPTCCATAAPFPWIPAGWSCIRTGRSRRPTSWTALAWPATSSLLR